MGIGFVLLIWSIVGTICAAVGTILMHVVATSATSRVRNPNHRKEAVKAATVFPFACLVWCGVMFIFQATVNLGLLHRDCGLGDGFGCPLSNGYALYGIDQTAHMRLYNPTTLPDGDGAIGDRTDAVDNVSLMQVSGSLVVGGTDIDRFSDNEKWIEGNADTYFILDTKNGTQKRYEHFQDFQRAVVRLGIKLDLRCMNEVYINNRRTWFDLLCMLLSIGLPFIYFCRIARWIIQLRKKTEPWF